MKPWGWLALFLSLLALVGIWLLTQSPSSNSGLRTLEILAQGRPQTLRIELAQHDEAWQKGLMFRKSMPKDQGMLFVFPEETDGGFWMKDTLIPLSIAFISSEGVILKIMDMTPCTEDPCTTYSPALLYTKALEVNQGWFQEHSVSVGDKINLKD